MESSQKREGRAFSGSRAGASSDAVRWLPILMYHRIVDEIDGPDPYYVKVTTREFESQMRSLRDQGYQSMTLDQLPDATRSSSRTEKSVVITFDDGYEDAYSHALPIVRKYGHCASVLLVADEVGKANTWDGEKVEAAPLLNMGQIEEMSRNGVCIGSHSLTHQRLTDLDPQRALNEIAGSKSTLEDMLGREVNTFAYPYGKTNAVLCGLAQEAGYSLACGIEQREHTMFNLSRVDAARCRSNALTWRLKLSGIHFRARRSSSLRQLKSIVNGRLRRRPPLQANRANDS